MKRLTVSGRACGETLALLIVIAWADGKLEPAEKEGIMGAVQVFNLPRETRDRIDALVEAKGSVADLKIGELSARERAFAYVAASWMAGIDDYVHTKEKDVLEQVAATLNFTPEQKAELATIATKLDRLPEGKQNWAEHITALFRAIPAQLEEPGEDFEVVFEG
jgi:tellurite resistance protein